jgi:putative NADH-flavin reductase
MKLLVLGSTGVTGEIIVEQALNLGHDVTAFARDPEKVTIRHKNLKVVKGDILEYRSLLPAVEGQDAVISALGIRTLKKNTIISDGTKNVLKAMKGKKVKRFICISSVGVGESKLQQKQLGLLYNRFMFPVILRNMFEDKEAQEKSVMESSLDWTIVRPVILTKGKKIGNYRALPPDDNSLNRFISRADVSDFILSRLSDGKYIKEAVSLSY